MGFRIRFGVGPIRYSAPLGRTGAQKRAAAKASAQRAQRRQGRKDSRAADRRVAEYNRPENVAARAAAEAERQSRTRRGVVTERAIDPLHGGSFKITDADGDSTLANVGPDAALHWLSLRKGDLAEITWGADGSGIEHFSHISRANGAVPRNPAGAGSYSG